ncbi:tryptophan-rich sensory protein [bacterium]|nr:tryptophan-rich sensory protein [bacterium]
MKFKINISLLLFIVGCLFVGFLSSFFSGEDIVATYFSLNRPSFAPPHWLFAPVWTVLYITMGVSVYLVWQKRDSQKIGNKMIIFFTQLFLNFWWPIIFFRWNNLSLAAYEILVLLVLIVVNIFCFKKVSPLAAYLLIPYAIWVFYATILTFTILSIN